MRLLTTPMRLLWRRPVSLRVKLVVAALLVALPSFLLTILGDAVLIQQRRGELPQTDLSTATTAASLVDASIDDAISVGWAIASVPSTLTLDPTALDPVLQRLRQSDSRLTNVIVLNAQGQSVGEMIPYPAGSSRVNLASQPFFVDPMLTNQPDVSGLVGNPRTGAPALVAAVPLRGPDGRPRGVVAVVLDLASLHSRLAEVPALTSRGVLVADPDGHLALTTGLSVPAGVASLASARMFQRALATGAATQDSGPLPPLDGSWLGGARASPRYHWVVAVVQPSTSVLEAFGPALWLEIGALLVAIALAAIAARYVSGRILGPVAELERAARAWSQGDLGERVAVRGNDELGELARTFNRMASSLSDSLQRLTETDRRLVGERNRLQAIVNTSPVGIMVMDADERVTLANPAAEALLGEKLSADEPARSYAVVTQLYHADGKPYKFDDLPIVCALRTGDTVIGSDVVIRRPNGWEEHLLVNAAPVRQASGTIVGSVAIFFDVTPLAEEERLRSEFVVSAAQEFRNPLTVIKGYAEIAMRDPKVQGTPIFDELQKIMNAANRLAHLAEDLLHAAQLHLPALLLRRVPLDLAELATHTVQDLEKQDHADRYHITVTTHPAMVDGDPKLLGEALTDLLRQAEAAMPDGGAIEVKVSAWDGIANLAVTDHGPVVPQEKIAALFRPFSLPGHQASYIATLRPSLLLYLAKRIVEESGGWIRAESGTRGTTIIVTLPRYVPESPSEHLSTKPTVTSDGHENGAKAAEGETTKTGER